MDEEGGASVREPSRTTLRQACSLRVRASSTSSETKRTVVPSCLCTPAFGVCQSLQRVSAALCLSTNLPASFLTESKNPTRSVMTALTPHPSAMRISSLVLTVHTQTSLPASRHSRRNSCPSLAISSGNAIEKPWHASRRKTG